MRRKRLGARVAAVRRDGIHRLTTRLAKTHGRIVVEGLDAAGMLRQKGLWGARSRRRALADAALGETRRQLRYKTAWYRSELVEADRFFPSSKTCHACGHVQDIGWAEHWTCAGCGVGPVGASVKRGADRKTRRAGQVAEKREVRKDNSGRSAA